MQRMHPAERRRERLAKILDLAQTYRSWTRKELARALRRDPTKLVPGSGIPKLDLVVDLAGVLDWSVEDVVSFFWEQPEDADHVDSATDFESIDATMRDAHREGDYGMLIRLAQRAWEISTDAEQRSRACNREAGGWDGLGRFQNAMKAVQRGLNQSPVTGEFRRVLQSNLANSYYTLWSLVEAKSLAGDLLTSFEVEPPVSLRDEKTRAFAHYVAGHSYRRLLSSEPDQLAVNGALAKRHLSAAIEQYEALAASTDDASLAGIAATCRGGILEIETMLGETDTIDALN
ncbi:MAG: hypothetical protein AAF368_19910, partial [Planctomycetota bacterium]